MGLEGIELVMAIEERFDIAIPDKEVERIRTPRDLMNFVSHQLSVQNTSECLSQRAFHRLRRSAIATLQIRRDKFQLSSTLDDLFPQRERRRVWEQYWTAVGVEDWPTLERNNLVLIAVSALAAAPLLLAVRFGLWTLAAGAAVFVIALVATQPLAVNIPRDLATVRDLVRVTLTWKGLQPSGGWSPESIRMVVRQVIIERLGITSDFSDDARFVEDLGLDQ